MAFGYLSLSICKVISRKLSDPADCHNLIEWLCFSTLPAVFHSGIHRLNPLPVNFSSECNVSFCLNIFSRDLIFEHLQYCTVCAKIT